MQITHKIKHRMAVDAYAFILKKPKITRSELNVSMKTAHDDQKNSALSTVLRDLLSLDILRKRLVPELSTVELWVTSAHLEEGESVRRNHEAVNWLNAVVPTVVNKLPQHESLVRPTIGPNADSKAETWAHKEEEFPKECEWDLSEPDPVAPEKFDSLLMGFLTRSRGPHTSAAVHAELTDLPKIGIRTRLAALWKSGKLCRRKSTTSVMEYWHPRWQSELQKFHNEVYSERKISFVREPEGHYSLQRLNGFKVKFTYDEFMAIRSHND